MTSAGAPMTTAVAISTACRMIPKPSAVRRGDPVTARQHGHARGLEDAEVRRRDGEHGGHVDREEDGRGRAEPGALLVEPERLEQHEARDPLERPGGELGRRGGRAQARLAEDGEAGAHARSAARRGVSQRRTRCERDGRPERSSAGATSTAASTASGAMA